MSIIARALNPSAPGIRRGGDSECDLVRDHETGSGWATTVRPPLSFPAKLQKRFSRPTHYKTSGIAREKHIDRSHVCSGR